MEGQTEHVHTCESINLGDKVVDEVTGFDGIAVARLEYLNGCLQFGVAPRAVDGKYPDTAYIDYQRLQVITPAQVTLRTEGGGGVMHDAPRARPGDACPNCM